MTTSGLARLIAGRSTVLHPHQHEWWTRLWVSACYTAFNLESLNSHIPVIRIQDKKAHEPIAMTCGTRSPPVVWKYLRATLCCALLPHQRQRLVIGTLSRLDLEFESRWTLKPDISLMYVRDYVSIITRHQTDVPILHHKHALPHPRLAWSVTCWRWSKCESAPRLHLWSRPDCHSPLALPPQQLWRSTSLKRKV